MKLYRKKHLDPNLLVLLKQISIGLLVIISVCLLLTAVWYGTRIQSLTITSVEASGGETINHVAVERLVEAQLDGLYLGLIPRRFAWLYPEAEILSAVEQIERIHNVKVARVKGTQVQVTYDEYVPEALWCREAERNKCAFLDEVGYAFAYAPNLSGGSLLRFVTHGREVTLHEVLLDKDSLANIHALVDLLANQGWFVSHVELDQVGDVFLKIVGGGELKVAEIESPQQIVDNLSVVLASDEFKHIKPGNFQYIDLRFGNKVFVNEKSAVPEEETAD